MRVRIFFTPLKAAFGRRPGCGRAQAPVLAGAIQQEPRLHDSVRGPSLDPVLGETKVRTYAYPRRPQDPCAERSDMQSSPYTLELGLIKGGNFAEHPVQGLVLAQPPVVCLGVAQPPSDEQPDASGRPDDKGEFPVPCQDEQDRETQSEVKQYQYGVAPDYSC
jgi:hypothetical protein